MSPLRITEMLYFLAAKSNKGYIIKYIEVTEFNGGVRLLTWSAQIAVSARVAKIAKRVVTLPKFVNKSHKISRPPIEI